MTSHPDHPRKIVVFGTGNRAALAHFYFREANSREVVAFTVDDDWMNATEFRGLPVVPFSKVASVYPPDDYGMFVAIGYARMNALRQEKFLEAQAMGFTLVSYVHPGSFIARDVEIGANCMVLENQLIQPFVRIGSNNVLGSGTYIGHHSTIQDNCFIGPRVAIASNVNVGCNSFLGVNAVIRNDVRIAPKSLIGAGALILRHTNEGGVYRGNETKQDGRRAADSTKI